MLCKKYFRKVDTISFDCFKASTVHSNDTYASERKRQPMKRLISSKSVRHNTQPTAATNRYIYIYVYISIEVMHIHDLMENKQYQ